MYILQQIKLYMFNIYVKNILV